MTVSSPKDEYKKLKAIEQLKEELLKAFEKTASLRAKKAELQAQLERINERLQVNDSIEEVLGRREFQGLEIAQSAEFLKEIEDLALVSQRRRKQKPMASDKSGGGRRKRSSQDEKRAVLIDFVRNHQGSDLMVRDFGRHLEQRGVTTPASAWLKSLGVPAVAMPDIQKGNRRAGKRLLPDKIRWLNDAVENQ